MNIVEEAREFALSEMKEFGFPTPALFDLSEKKAIELATKLNADLSVVKIGSYLMDIKLGQAIKENRLSEHIQMGIEATMKFLSDYDLEETQKSKVLNCIAAHHGTVPFECIEAEICANADCYRFVHPKGFFVFLTTLGRDGITFSECLNRAEQKVDEKYNILSLDICKQELEPYYQTLKQYISDARSL